MNNEKLTLTKLSSVGVIVSQAFCSYIHFHAPIERSLTTGQDI